MNKCFSTNVYNQKGQPQNLKLVKNKLVGVFASGEVEENKHLLWKYLLFESCCPVQILKDY